MAYERFPLVTTDIDELKTKLDSKLVPAFFHHSTKNAVAQPSSVIGSNGNTISYYKNENDADPTFTVSLSATTVGAYVKNPITPGSNRYYNIKLMTCDNGFGYLYINENGFVLTTQDTRAVCAYFTISDTKSGMICKNDSADPGYDAEVGFVLSESDGTYINFRYEPLLAQTLFSISPVCYLGLDEGYSEYAYITVASTMAAPSGFDYDKYSVIEIGDNQFLATYAWAFKLQ